MQLVNDIALRLTKLPTDRFAELFQFAKVVALERPPPWLSDTSATVESKATTVANLLRARPALLLALQTELHRTKVAGPWQGDPIRHMVRLDHADNHVATAVHAPPGEGDTWHAITMDGSTAKKDLPSLEAAQAYADATLIDKGWILVGGPSPTPQG
jgi:hypothetical protein